MTPRWTLTIEAFDSEENPGEIKVKHPLHCLAHVDGVSHFELGRTLHSLGNMLHDKPGIKLEKFVPAVEDGVEDENEGEVSQ